MDRSKTIIKTSILGIIVNILLVIFKATIGLIVNSIAIVLDAVNNLSDALSSIITIIGTKLAGKAPDKKHPFGHGRIEYFSSLIIGTLVLIAGLTSAKESVEKIINPAKADYTTVSLIIISVAVVVKFFFGKYVKKTGEKINSQSLIASGTDAFMDSVLSLTTLIAAIISLVWGISLEGYLGVIISIIIIKSSIEIMRETINSIIGERADPELTKKLKDKVNEIEEVHGVYDVILHNYGPTEIIGSIHIQVDDNMTAKEIHKLTRKIQMLIYSELGITLTVGIYASNSSTELSRKMNARLNELISANPEILQMHGFYIDEENKNVSFDMIFDYGVKETDMIKNNLIDELKKDFPEFTYNVVIDSNYSES